MSNISVQIAHFPHYNVGWFLFKWMAGWQHGRAEIEWKIFEWDRHGSKLFLFHSKEVAKLSHILFLAFISVSTSLIFFFWNSSIVYFILASASCVNRLQASTIASSFTSHDFDVNNTDHEDTCINLHANFYKNTQSFNLVNQYRGPTIFLSNNYLWSTWY